MRCPRSLKLVDDNVDKGQRDAQVPVSAQTTDCTQKRAAEAFWYPTCHSSIFRSNPNSEILTGTLWQLSLSQVTLEHVSVTCDHQHTSIYYLSCAGASDKCPPVDNRVFALWNSAHHILLCHTEHIIQISLLMSHSLKSIWNATCLRVPWYNVKILLTSEETWPIPEKYLKKNASQSFIELMHFYDLCHLNSFSNYSGNVSSFSSFFSTATV